MAKYTTGTIDAEDVDWDEIDFAVDTALSWDGNFPAAGEGDFLVTLGSILGGGEVLVSRRYVGAGSPDNAAEIALGAYAERHDFPTDDDGNLLPTDTDGNPVDEDTEGETGIPVWVERVDKVIGNVDEEDED